MSARREARTEAALCAQLSCGSLGAQLVCGVDEVDAGAGAMIVVLGVQLVCGWNRRGMSPQCSARKDEPSANVMVTPWERLQR